MPGMNEIRRLNDMLQEHPKFGTPQFVIYPLHSRSVSFFSAGPTIHSLHR